MDSFQALIFKAGRRPAKSSWANHAAWTAIDSQEN